ncbi:MAG: SUMF1/EgtB/PvdO family nonheme iron enzyme [Chloroflexi bacterium]|nr:SUMF1/EgtB/PvdO family nonheme iron enzyme [Chloroflexota bacterium]
MTKRKKLFGILLIVLVSASAVSISNLDIGLRSWRAFREGKLSTLRLRYELAAFDIARPSPNLPVDTKTSSVDGMMQVYVPEGEFIMGDNGNPSLKEYPEHPVYLDAFWMDKYEVSNAMYEKCVASGACLEPVPRLNPYYGKWAYRNLPVVYANWYAAEAYCSWAGRRLPTEAEWEKAARGTDARYFPWGNSKANPRLVNFSETLFLESLPVTRYPLGASPYGALNMAGNVREWVADWFYNRYYFESPYENPTGPETGTERSLRGGAYDAVLDDISTFRRFKHEPDSAGLSRGFRCTESAD